MDTPVTPSYPFAPIDSEQSDEPASSQTLRHQLARAVALLVGAGIALLFATNVHTAIAVSLLMLAAVLLVVGAMVKGHRSGRRPLRMEQFRPSAPMAGNLPTVR